MAFSSLCKSYLYYNKAAYEKTMALDYGLVEDSEYKDSPAPSQV
jgi:hypothetical protein